MPRATPCAKTIAKLHAEIEGLKTEKAKLLKLWEANMDTGRRVLALMDALKSEYATIASQRDQWRQVAARYRTMLDTPPPIPVPQGDPNAIDDRTVDSAPK